MNLCRKILIFSYFCLMDILDNSRIEMFDKFWLDMLDTSWLDISDTFQLDMFDILPESICWRLPDSKNTILPDFYVDVGYFLTVTSCYIYFTSCFWENWVLMFCFNVRVYRRKNKGKWKNEEHQRCIQPKRRISWEIYQGKFCACWNNSAAFPMTMLFSMSL